MIYPVLTASQNTGFQRDKYVSVPEYMRNVLRTKQIVIKYVNVHDTTQYMYASLLAAVALQYYIDYLEELFLLAGTILYRPIDVFGDAHNCSYKTCYPTPQ